MFPTPIQKASLKINITYKVLLIITLILWLLPLIAVMMTSVRTGEDILKGNMKNDQSHVCVIHS